MCLQFRSKKENPNKMWLQSHKQMHELGSMWTPHHQRMCHNPSLCFNHKKSRIDPTSVRASGVRHAVRKLSMKIATFL
jgi:hypothetical protein